jgi:hypothetical protein
MHQGRLEDHEILRDLPDQRLAVADDRDHIHAETPAETLSA